MGYLGGSPAGFFNAAVEHAADIFSDSRMLGFHELYRNPVSANDGVTIRWVDPPVNVFLGDRQSVHQCADAIGAAFAEYDKQQQKKNPIRRLRARVRKAA